MIAAAMIGVQACKSRIRATAQRIISLVFAYGPSAEGGGQSQDEF